MTGTSPLSTTESHPRRQVANWLALAFASILLIFITAPGGHAAISLIYPPAKTSVAYSNHLVIKFNNLEVTGAKVTINGLVSDLLPIGTTEYRSYFQDFLVLQPIWDLGKNDIVIETFNGEKKVDSLAATIYYSPKDGAVPVPKEFAPAVLHLAEVEKVCQPCHNMRPTLAQVTNALEKENPCYSCHKRMANRKYVHGPAGTFSCGYCHSLQGQPRYGTPKRDVAICYECHADKAVEFKKFKYLHGPVAAGMCEICHDSHGSDNPGQLRLPINQMCLSCHESIAKGPHVTRTATGDSHPVADKTDPSPKAAGRPMSCVSCHNPHGGEFRYYFQNNAEDRMMLCQMCHQK
jgi:predicted CXXCH cytochrome family protein